VGQNASGARIQAGSAFTGISDTIAIGHVLYDFGFPIVPEDNLWVLARENPAQFTVVPIGDIHIFIGETNPTPATKDDFQRIDMAETPIRAAFELDTKEESSDLELFKSSRSDLKTNSTQPALEVEEVVDDHYESSMGNLSLETPWYCLVAFAGTTSGSASNGDGSPSESILEALNKSGESDDWENPAGIWEFLAISQGLTGAFRRLVWFAFAMLCWTLWTVRNKLTIEGTVIGKPADAMCWGYTK
jgi:hypothetical protein